MACVLVGQNGTLHGDLPVYLKSGVQDGDAAVGFGVVELVALVLEDGGVAEYDEAVCKAFGDEELAVVFGAELDGDVLPVGRGALAYVNGYVQDASLHAAYYLALCVWGTLEVKAAHDSVAGHGFVVLYEDDWVSVLGYCELLVKFAL